jgi:hypothetical protein
MFGIVNWVSKLKTKKNKKNKKYIYIYIYILCNQGLKSKLVCFHI